MEIITELEETLHCLETQQITAYQFYSRLVCQTQKKHLELKNKPTPILDYLFAYVATQYHLFADKLTEYQLNLPREIRKEELTKNRKQKKPFRMKDPFQVSQCRQN